MGQGEFVSSRADFVIQGKAVLDWVSDAEMAEAVPFDPVTGVANCMSSSCTYYLSPTDATSKPASGATMGVSIKTSTPDRYFFIEFRNSATASTGGPAALITWSDIITGGWTGKWGHSLLVDCTPSTLDWTDAGCAPGTSVVLDTGEPWDSKKISVFVGEVQGNGKLQVDIVSGGSAAPTVTSPPTITLPPSPLPTISLYPCSEVILEGSYSGSNSQFLAIYKVQGLDVNGNPYFNSGGVYMWYMNSGSYWMIGSTVGGSSGYWYSYGSSSWPPTSGWTVSNNGWTATSATMTCVSTSAVDPPPVTTRGGNCAVVNNCFTSSNYPSNYATSESCIFTIKTAGALSVEAFSTELGYDKLMLKGVEYHGTTGPDGVNVGIGDTLWWTSDTATASSGFSICVDVTTSAQPTSEPTLEPSRPTPLPTPYPVPQPTLHPTPEPTCLPTPKPTPRPSHQPTPEPTFVPTQYVSPLCLTDSSYTRDQTYDSGRTCHDVSQDWRYSSLTLMCSNSDGLATINSYAQLCCSDKIG
jgi:hypothetical protein